MSKIVADNKKSLDDGGHCSASSSPMSSSRTLVIAKHKFEGRNNDELSFDKNDVITVIQQLEGGWWEGSLDGRIGWFPSNFVGIVNNLPSNSATPARLKATLKQSECDDGQLELRMLHFRAELLDNFVAKLRENRQQSAQTVAMLHALAGKGAKISNFAEFSSIFKLLEDIMKLQHTLLSQLEEQKRKPVSTQLVGKLFLETAGELRAFLRAYCVSHCELMGLIKPGDQDDFDAARLHKNFSLNEQEVKQLIVGLFHVFRHIAKHASTLLEIERNTPDGHPDKGNLHRAAAVYRELHSECETLRRQREAQLDMLRTGALQQTFGAQFEQRLGRFLYIGGVTAATEQPTANSANSGAGEAPLEEDRCLTVFERAILLWKIRQSDSNKGNADNNRLLTNQFSTDGLSVQCSGDTINQIRIIEKGKKNNNAWTLRTIGREDHAQLVDALRQCDGLSISAKGTGEDSIDGFTVRKDNSQSDNVDGRLRRNNGFEKPFADGFGQKAAAAGNIRLNHQLEMILPDDDENHSLLPDSSIISSANANEAASHSKVEERKKLFSGWSLRPYPPLRPEWLPNSANEGQHAGQVKLRKGLTTEEQEDALLLKIVEGYCISGGTLAGNFSPSNAAHHLYNRRPYHHYQQRNSAESCCHSPCGGGQVRRAASYPEQHEIGGVRPQIIVAEDEKLFVEEMEGDKLIVKERSLVDTVYTLKDQIAVLAKEVSTIGKALEQEQRARRRMEELLRQQLQLQQPNNNASENGSSAAAGNDAVGANNL